MDQLFGVYMISFFRVSYTIHWHRKNIWPSTEVWKEIWRDKNLKTTLKGNSNFNLVWIAGFKYGVVYKWRHARFDTPSPHRQAFYY
jgi:hypothetical protein